MLSYKMEFGDLISLSKAAYYSPGRCPQYYTPYRVTTSIPGVVTAAPNAPATASGDNIYLCCPGPLTPNNINPKLECASFYRRSTAFDVHNYNNKVNPGVIEPATMTTLSSGFPYTFLAYGIQVRFQNSDVKGLNFDENDVEAYGLREAVLGGTFAITTNSAKETSEDASEPTSSRGRSEENSSVDSSGDGGLLNDSTETNSNAELSASIGPNSLDGVVGATSSDGDGGDSNGGGLSTGAKIGIGLGIPFVILLIAFAGLFIFLRERSKRRSAPEVPAAPPPPPPAMAMGAANNAHSAPVYEADPEAKVGTNSRVEEVGGYHSPPGFRVESPPVYGAIHEVNGYNHHEIGGAGRYEIDGNARYEMDGYTRQQPQELHGSGRMPY